MEKKHISRLADYILVFDVDGVLTHTNQKKMTEKKLLTSIINALKNKIPVIFNSGRSMEFIEENILNPLKAEISDLDLLADVLAIGEQGAVTAEYIHGQGFVSKIDGSISVPEFLQQDVKKLIKRKYSQMGFYDESKKTMITVEMLDGMSLDEFSKAQAILDKELEALVANYGLSARYKVDTSRIASNVQNVFVGKGFGVQKALSWLNSKNIDAKRYIAFGDSLSDIDMAQELLKFGKAVEFVFVGEKELLSGLKITFSSKRCEEGTLEFLNSIEL